MGGRLSREGNRRRRRRKERGRWRGNRMLWEEAVDTTLPSASPSRWHLTLAFPKVLYRSCVALTPSIPPSLLLSLPPSLLLFLPPSIPPLPLPLLYNLMFFYLCLFFNVYVSGAVPPPFPFLYCTVQFIPTIILWLERQSTTNHIPI